MGREVIGGGSAIRLVSGSFVPQGGACVARGTRIDLHHDLSCFSLLFLFVRVNFNRAERYSLQL